MQILGGWGPVNVALVCPHCQTKGNVHVRQVKREGGVSSAKLIGGLLTGWRSLYVTGLSRKEKLTRAHCDYCGSTWEF